MTQFLKYQDLARRTCGGMSHFRWWACAVCCTAAPLILANVASAQRVILFEDFESSTPDLPANDAVESLDSFNRSEVLENDPGTITVSGGMFVDPFGAGAGLASDFNADGSSDGSDFLIWQRGFGQSPGASTKAAGDANSDQNVDGNDLGVWRDEYGNSGGGGNKSLVFHNPNSAVQEAANWYSIFPSDTGDPNFFFKNGAIEFDVYLEQVPSNGYWTYLGIRLGFEFDPDNRNQVSTTGDQTIWNSFRLKEGGLDAASPTNTFFDQVNSLSVMNEDVVAPNQRLHVRYDIDGTSGVYSVFIDNLDDPDPEVEVIGDAPWAQVFNFQTFMNEPAPGINEITFITDASSRGIGSMAAGNVFLDNLKVIDNDQLPDAAVSSVPEPSSAALTLVAFLALVAVGKR